MDSGQSFEADFFSLEDTGETLVAGFAKNPDHPESYTLFIRSYIDREPERKIYVERDDQSQSGYDLVERIELFEDKAIVWFTGAANMKNPEVFPRPLTIRFAPSKIDLGVVRAGLQRVFAETNVKVA
jgi:hypothetical protein